MSTWKIDLSHSKLNFKVKHLMVSNVIGEFLNFDGTLSSNDDTFANSKVEISIEANSITTNDPNRDGHLKSPDFLDSTTFPKIEFNSTNFVLSSDNRYSIKGKLTMKGVTKEVSFTASLNGFAKAMDGARVAAFEIIGEIDRTEFGVLWNSPIDTGGVVVSEIVKFEANIEFKETN